MPQPSCRGVCVVAVAVLAATLFEPSISLNSQQVHNNPVHNNHLMHDLLDCIEFYIYLFFVFSRAYVRTYIHRLKISDQIKQQPTIQKDGILFRHCFRLLHMLPTGMLHVQYIHLLVKCTVQYVHLLVKCTVQYVHLSHNDAIVRLLESCRNL